MAIKKFPSNLKWPIVKAKTSDIPVIVHKPASKSLNFWHYDNADKKTLGLTTSELIKGLNATGCEIEFKFGFDPTRTVAIRNWAMMNTILNRNHEDRSRNKRMATLEGVGDLQAFYRNAIADTVTDLLAAPPHDDDGCIENVFLPVSLKALQYAKYEIQKVCYIAEIFGAIDRAPGAGLHLSADRTLFGLTGPEEENTVSNFLIWLYLNKDFMINFSYRDDYNKVRASVDYFLGDSLQRLSPIEKIYQLKVKKADILAYINPKPATTSTATASSSPWGGYSSYSPQSMLNGHMPNTETSRYGSNHVNTAAIGAAFNIKWNNDNRGIHEFRWFASTLDYRRIISWYEWYFAIIEFCRTKFNVTLNAVTERTYVDNSMKDFCEFVKTNKSMYMYLYNYLIQDNYSKDFMLGCALETPLEYTDEEIMEPDFYKKLTEHICNAEVTVTSVNSLSDITQITALSPAATVPNIVTPEEVSASVSEAVTLSESFTSTQPQTVEIQESLEEDERAFDTDDDDDNDGWW